MIPIINTAVVSGPTDLQCATVLTADQVPHWVLEERDVSVTITVPDDLAVVDAFEVGPGVVFDLDFPRTIDGRRITVSNIPLSNDTPIRMLVVAANDEVRGDIESNFGDLDRP